MLNNNILKICSNYFNFLFFYAPAIFYFPFEIFHFKLNGVKKYANLGDPLVLLVWGMWVGREFNWFFDWMSVVPSFILVRFTFNYSLVSIIRSFVRSFVCRSNHLNSCMSLQIFFRKIVRSNQKIFCLSRYAADCVKHDENTQCTRFELRFNPYRDFEFQQLFPHEIDFFQWKAAKQTEQTFRVYSIWISFLIAWLVC